MKIRDRDWPHDIEERACIIAESCGLEYEEALRLAQEQEEQWKKKLQGNKAWKQGQLV